MNRTAEVNRRSQVEEYLSEEVIRRSKLESGNSKRGFGVCLMFVERCWDQGQGQGRKVN